MTTISRTFYHADGRKQTVPLTDDGEPLQADSEGQSSHWTTSRELVARGVPDSSQRQARRDGRLPFVSLGNDEFAYAKADVDRWLSGRAGNKQGREETPPSRRRGQADGLANRAASRAATTAPAQNDPIDEAERAASKIQSDSGCTRREALQQVFRADDSLRAEYVKAHNQNRRARDQRERAEARAERLARNPG